MPPPHPHPQHCHSFHDLKVAMTLNLPSHLSHSRRIPQLQTACHYRLAPNRCAVYAQRTITQVQQCSNVIMSGQTIVTKPQTGIPKSPKSLLFFILLIFKRHCSFLPVFWLFWWMKWIVGMSGPIRVTHQFEIVERTKDDLVSAFDKTHSC